MTNSYIPVATSKFFWNVNVISLNDSEFIMNVWSSSSPGKILVAYKTVRSCSNYLSWHENCLLLSVPHKTFCFLEVIQVAKIQNDISPNSFLFISIVKTFMSIESRWLVVSVKPNSQQSCTRFLVAIVSQVFHLNRKLAPRLSDRNTSYQILFGFKEAWWFLSKILQLLSW